MVDVELRPMRDADLPVIFEQMRDPVAVRMAAFTAEDPDDRAAFERHMARLRADPGIIHRVIVADGVTAGTVGAFEAEGNTEVTYWVDRSLWGRGIAGTALRLLLAEVEARPVYARIAEDNVASRRVLEKAGFRVVGSETGWASARQAEILERVLRLD